MLPHIPKGGNWSPPNPTNSSKEAMDSLPKFALWEYTTGTTDFISEESVFHVKDNFEAATQTVHKKIDSPLLPTTDDELDHCWSFITDDTLGPLPSTPGPYSSYLDIIYNFLSTDSPPRDPAILLDNLEPEKRFRSPPWTAEEKRAYLELKVEAMQAVKGKVWDFISVEIWKRYGFKRSSKCCENLWGTLLKGFGAIRDHELPESGPLTCNWVSYWEMDEDARSKEKLPRLFPLEWYKMMETILVTQERSGKKSKRIAVQKSVGKHLYTHPADLVGDGSLQDTQGEVPHLTNRVEMPNLTYSGTCAINEGDLVPAKQQLVEDAVDSTFGHLASGKRSGEQDDLMSALSPLVKQQVHDTLHRRLQPLVSKKRSSSTIDGDDLITRLAPFLKHKIEDAVSSALQPICSALQVLEQGDQEYDEKLRALAEKRRALDREELQLKRQRVCRQQRTPRTSDGKPHVLRAKNSTTEGIIPAFKGMNIANDGDQINNMPGA